VWVLEAGHPGSFTVIRNSKPGRSVILEPLIPPASTQYFGQENYEVLHNLHTRMVYDDARHYIFTTRDKFDVITTDPSIRG